MLKWSYLSNKFLQYSFFQHHFERQFRAIMVKFGLENYFPNNHTMVLDTEYRWIRLYMREMKMIRNPRVMIMYLIILCKEIIKNMLNILIVYFIHKHSSYKYINYKHTKNSQFSYKGSTWHLGFEPVMIHRIRFCSICSVDRFVL